MSVATFVVQLLGGVFLALTAAGSLAAAWRHRDGRRLDILLFILALSLFSWARSPALIYARLVAFLALPALLWRLIWYFRDVPRAFLIITLLNVAVGVGVFSVYNRLDPSNPILADEVALLSIYPAVVLYLEGRRSRGVSAMRLNFAAGGTIFVVVLCVLMSAGHASQLFRKSGELNQFIHLGLFFCFFVAFNTPRRLIARWQRTEQARYLSATSDKDAEHRGLTAADDLRDGAERSVASVAVLVGLSPAEAGPDLVVRSTTRKEFAGAVLPGLSGLLHQVVTGRAPLAGTPRECPPDLATRLAPIASEVLVAPIVTKTRVWGLVLVAQRRGSLFRDDDLHLLAQLGRYTGTALDHAALVAEDRERERRRADRRLREAESRMSLMLDSIKDYAMYVLDDEGFVMNWHVGAEHTFGHSGAEMVGEPAAPLYELPPDEFQRRLADARRLGREAWEGSCRRRDGGRFVGVTVVRPLEAEAGDVRGFVVVTRDVTERRELEDRLRQSQKMEVVGQLAGGIAHDFNNLLLAMIGYADVLAQELSGDDHRLEAVHEIQKAADRAASLTRQLLAFSRRQLLQQATIEISRLVRDLLPMLRRVIGEHLEIVVNAAPQPVYVLGDRSQIENAIVNLAVNARDAMPHGGRLTIQTGRVDLGQSTADREVAPGPYALLEVIDTGTGMDAATRQRIFEPFFTTKEVGQGTGLGLATVYGIVRQMGGMIGVESEPQRGSAFRLYLPETLPREEPAPTPPPGKPGGSETILLVEDEQSVRTFLARTLERHGYHVLDAEHPAAALALAQAHTEPIHLVVTDVVLPGSVGPEFVRALTALRGEIPVLYISGYADASLPWEGNAPKARHFLQKPFSAGDLLTRIRQILGPAA